MSSEQISKDAIDLALWKEIKPTLRHMAVEAYETDHHYGVKEIGFALWSVTDEQILAAQAEIDRAAHVTDAEVLAFINEQRRVIAQDLAFDSLREAIEYLGESYIEDTRSCLEAARKAKPR